MNACYVHILSSDPIRRIIISNIAKNLGYEIFDLKTPLSRVVEELDSDHRGVFICDADEDDSSCFNDLSLIKKKLINAEIIIISNNESPTFFEKCLEVNVLNCLKKLFQIRLLHSHFIKRKRNFLRKNQYWNYSLNIYLMKKLALKN